MVSPSYRPSECALCTCARHALVLRVPTRSRWKRIPRSKSSKPSDQLVLAPTFRRRPTGNPERTPACRLRRRRGDTRGFLIRTTVIRFKVETKFQRLKIPTDGGTRVYCPTGVARDVAGLCRGVFGGRDHPLKMYCRSRMTTICDQNKAKSRYQLNLFRF